MISGPDILAIPFAAMLASSSLTCTLPEPPEITVRPVSNAIVYNYSRSAADLTRVRGDAATPYAPGTDAVSGGLREDSPVITTKMNWGVQSYPQLKQGCMWYDTIDVEIKLSPRIFIAREFNQGVCRDAILEHEKHHVDVDRKVMNKYAIQIGKAIQAAVNKSGVSGPFNTADMEKVKQQSTRRIEAVIEAQEALLLKEMAVLQGQVDSLEEYKRISEICKDVKVPR